MTTSITLVVSIDGVAPRYVNTATMPNVCELAHSGASCFNAQTVAPSITLPAHASMLRGVPPEQHGIFSNDDSELRCKQPSFLALARSNGLSTAACFNWKPFERLMEPAAVAHLLSFDGGYDADDDEHTVALTASLLKRRQHQLVFAYISQPDLAGHSAGWGSELYIEALRKSDQLLGDLIASLSPQDSVLVTTDHGGEGVDHERSRAQDLQTFLVARSPLLTPKSAWQRASILDVAPTVASLCGLDPDQGWTGQSLIGREVALADTLLDSIQSLQAHEYGERVNMLQHSLLSAATAQADGAPDSVVLACLLHDVGHIMGDAGQWGLPSHADVGATALQQILPPSIVEPIRAHVEAKRYLVASEPGYADALSEASKQSLQEQGGPMSKAEMLSFEANPYFSEALALRRYDDGGKSTQELVPPLTGFQEILKNCLAYSPVMSAHWARDACRCGQCRSSDNGQHFLDVSDLVDWHVVASSFSQSTQAITLRHSDGAMHECLIEHNQPSELPKVFWGSKHRERLYSSATRDGDDFGGFFQSLCTYGIALVCDLSSEPGKVLDFAAGIGFVRDTNYGRLFDVVTEPEPVNLAYTPVGLPLHTDNPYRAPTPTVQLLHCLSAAKNGGDSYFADGFRAAQNLRETYPDYFLSLSNTMLNFRFRSAEAYLSDSKPMIQLATDGTVQAIHLNHRSMEPPDLSVADAEHFYRAYECFVGLLNDSDSILKIPLQSGQLIAFDNRRVLHGRAGFHVSERRHLQGCYIDIDAIESAARLRLVG